MNNAALKLSPERTSDRTHLSAYAEAIACWCARFDTAEIAAQLGLPEALIARWVANYRDLMRTA